MPHKQAPQTQLEHVHQHTLSIERKIKDLTHGNVNHGKLLHAVRKEQLAQRKLLQRILKAVEESDQATSLGLTVGTPELKPRTERNWTMPAEVTLNSEQRVKATIAPRTSKGKPSAVQAGTLVASVDNASATIEMIDDSSFWVNGTEEDGDAIVTVEADADLGEGVVTIRDTITVHVADAPATNLGLGLGAVEDQP